MGRLIDCFRRDRVWWITLASVFLVAAVFAFFVMRAADRAAMLRAAAEPVPAMSGDADRADAGAAASVPDLTVQEEDLSDLPKGARQVAANVTAIIVRTEDDKVYMGNGTAIRPGIVLTANHVVNKGSSEIMIICGAEQVTGTILQQDFATDTAILKAPGCGKDSLKIVPTKPSVDDVLFVTGFLPDRNAKRPTIARQLGTTSRVPQARLVFTDGLQDERLARQMSEAMTKRSIRPMALAGAQRQGMSGSPIFMADGRIIGLVSMADNARNRTFVIPAWVIERELLRAGIK